MATPTYREADDVPGDDLLAGFAANKNPDNTDSAMKAVVTPIFTRPTWQEAHGISLDDIYAMMSAGRKTDEQPWALKCRTT